MKPQGGISLGGVRARDVWGIGGRTGPPGGVEDDGVLLVEVVAPLEFWVRPVSG